MQIGSNSLTPNQSQAYGNSVSSQSLQHQSYQEKTGDISIITDEGDVVTFSQSSMTSLKMSSESFATPLASGMTFSAQAAMTESLTFTVEGDLNEQELADIANLYESLTTIASDFFNGDYGQAMVRAMSLGDLGSLASLDASFTQTQITASQITSYHAIPADNESLVDAFRDMDLPEKNDEIQEQNLLATRWKQISDFLDKQGEVLQDREGQDQKYQNHSREMMAEIAENIEKHPRLSPFTIPLTDRAVKAVAGNEERSPLRHLNQKNFLQNNFFKEFQNWLVA